MTIYQSSYTYPKSADRKSTLSLSQWLSNEDAFFFFFPTSSPWLTSIEDCLFSRAVVPKTPSKQSSSSFVLWNAIAHKHNHLNNLRPIGCAMNVMGKAVDSASSYKTPPPPLLMKRRRRASEWDPIESRGEESTAPVPPPSFSLFLLLGEQSLFLVGYIHMLDQISSRSFGCYTLPPTITLLP